MTDADSVMLTRVIARNRHEKPLSSVLKVLPRTLPNSLTIVPLAFWTFYHDNIKPSCLTEGVGAGKWAKLFQEYPTLPFCDFEKLKSKNLMFHTKKNPDGQSGLQMLNQVRIQMQTTKLILRQTREVYDVDYST